MRHLPTALLSIVLATITLGLAGPVLASNVSQDRADPLEAIGKALRAALVVEAEAEVSLNLATADTVSAKRSAAEAAAALDKAALAARQRWAELEEARATRKRLEVAYQKALAAKPVEPPDPPVTDDPWTFAYAEMTLAEAKTAAEARVTGILAAAPERVAGDPGYDVVFKSLAGLGDNGTLRNQSWYGRWGKVLGCTKYHFDENGVPTYMGKSAEYPDGPGDAELVPRVAQMLTLDNLAFAPYPEALGGSGGFKWAVRMGNIPAATLSRLQMTGELRSGRQSPKEHGLYLDVSGNVIAIDCLWKNLGGHGHYINNRPEPFQRYGRQSLYFAAKPTWSCTNVIQIDNEQDGSRGAFNFTFNDAGSYAFPGTVILEDCVSIMGWDFQREQGNNVRHAIEPYRQGEVRACGSMVVTNYVYTGQEGWPTEQITLDSVVFWAVQGRHSLASLRNAENYLFKDSFFKTEDHANPFIEVGSKSGNGSFRMPASVVVENCLDEGLDLKIWTSATAFEVFDMSTVGERFTWTPSGTTLEDI